MKIYKTVNFKLIINLIGLALLITLSIVFYQKSTYLSALHTHHIIDTLTYTQKLNIALMIFIATAIFTFIIIFNLEKKIIDNEKSTKSYIDKLEIFHNFYTQLHSTKGIKNISNIALVFISKQLKSFSGTIYIVNYKNMNLQLVGTYQQDINKTIKLQDMYLGIMGEAVSTQKIKIKHHKGLTTYILPLVDDKKTIGAIELKFYRNTTSLKISKQIKTILKIIASTLVKEIDNETNKKYFKLIDKNVIISSTNTEGTITFVSEAFCNATLYDKKELLGNNHRLLKHPSVKDEIFRGLWNTIKTGNMWKKELPNLKKDGTTYWAKTSISPELDFYGNIIGYNAIREDITDKKYIEQISIEDSLTGLYNRRYFDKTIKKQINLVKRFQKTLMFGILDIDHFKQYNDTYGHQEGDNALQKVATCLTQNLKRENDFIFRLGGEEFGILYFVENSNEGISIANKLRENIEQLKINHIKNSVSDYLTISCGIFTYKGEDISIESIYKSTDDLLYKAKKSGRNQVMFN